MTWKILEEIKENNRMMYKVQCGCGKVALRRQSHVLSGRTKSCKPCSAKLTASKYPMPVNKTGYAGLSGTHYTAIKAGAKRRGLEFSVKPKELYELYMAQNQTCAVSGVPILLLDVVHKNNPDWGTITASLDRIDSSKGYTPGNVWWVHKRINRLKNDFSMDELLYWSQAIVKQHGNPEPSRSSDAAEGATTRDRVSQETVIIPTSAQPVSEFADKPWKEVVETIAAGVYYKAFANGDDIV